MLVVVEHRYVHAFAQLLFNVKTFGRLDVFQVDAAQRGLHGRDHVHQLVRVALGQFDVEHVYAGELLEQATLALHHRLGRQRADVAQAQHGRAVGDHAHEVAARGVFGRQRGVGLDVQAGVGHARRIGQRQVALVGQRLGRRDGNLAARGCAVVLAGGLAQGVFGRCQLLFHGVLLGKNRMGPAWPLYLQATALQGLPVLVFTPRPHVAWKCFSVPNATRQDRPGTSAMPSGHQVTASRRASRALAAPASRCP